MLKTWQYVYSFLFIYFFPSCLYLIGTSNFATRKSNSSCCIGRTIFFGSYYYVEPTRERKRKNRFNWFCYKITFHTIKYIMYRIAFGVQSEKQYLSIIASVTVYKYIYILIIYTYIYIYTIFIVIRAGNLFVGFRVYNNIGCR